MSEQSCRVIRAAEEYRGKQGLSYGGAVSAQSVEAGLASAEDARRLAKADGLPLVRLLLEPKEQDLEAAHAAVDAMLTVLEPLHPTLPRLLHGLDHTTWPLLERSLALGYEVRIGLEDTLTLPDGNPTPDNVALVEYTVQRAQEAGSRKP
ncbi:MAG: hypothetical protein C4333_04535 [Meiothermus sp.]